MIIDIDFCLVFLGDTQFINLGPLAWIFPEFLLSRKANDQALIIVELSF